MSKKLCFLSIGLSLASPLAAEEPLLENQKSIEVQKQAAGEYPELHREPTVPLAAIQHAWDDAPVDAGAYLVNFNPRQTIRLTAREFMTTSIIFPAWETIKTVIIGDETNYQVLHPEPHIVTVRPTGYIGVDTSITMVGESGHVYGFYFRTEGHNSERTSDITVRINVPTPLFAKGQKRAAILQAKNDYLDQTFFDATQLSFNFSMAGDQSIAPNLVYSDGVRTWFDYGEHLDTRRLPTFYSVVDGYQQAINVTLEGTRLVAQGSGNFVLKSGDKVTCVYPTPDKKLSRWASG